MAGEKAQGSDKKSLKELLLGRGVSLKEGIRNTNRVLLVYYLALILITLVFNVVIYFSSAATASISLALISSRGIPKLEYLLVSWLAVVIFVAAELTRTSSSKTVAFLPTIVFLANIFFAADSLLLN